MAACWCHWCSILTRCDFRQDSSPQFEVISRFRQRWSAMHVSGKIGTPHANGWLWLFYQNQSLKDLSDLSTTFGINNDQNPWSPKTVPPTWHLWCLGKMVSPPAWRKIHQVGPSKIRRKEHDIEQDSMESDGKKNILNILNQFKSHLVYKSKKIHSVSNLPAISPSQKRSPPDSRSQAPACGGSK